MFFSIEVLKRSEYSFSSDTYSFAITMVEIFTEASTPYLELKVSEVIDQIPTGYRMSCPKGCPSNVFELIQMCWDQDPQKRPKFSEIEKKLETILENSN